MNDQPSDMRIRRPLWPAALIVLALAALVAWIMLRSGPLQGETNYDAGVVRIETSPHYVHHEFELTNESSSPVRIDGAKATCGCTEFIQPDSTVDPGETIVIPVSLELTMSGHKKGGVVLMLGDGSRVHLVMSATVERAFPLAVSPNPVDLSKRGMRPYVDIEWPGDERPPLAVVTTTGGAIAEAGPWKLKANASASNGRLAIWTAKMRIEKPQGNVAGPGSMTIQVGDTPAITVGIHWAAQSTTESPAVEGPVAPATNSSTTADSAPAEAPAG
jgi:hypothetical protein